MRSQSYIQLKILYFQSVINLQQCSMKYSIVPDTFLNITNHQGAHILHLKQWLSTKTKQISYAQNRWLFLFVPKLYLSISQEIFIDDPRFTFKSILLIFFSEFFCLQSFQCLKMKHRSCSRETFGFLTRIPPKATEMTSFPIDSVHVHCNKRRDNFFNTLEIL